MFVQMFDRFRPYFTVLVGGFPALFVLPLAMRLHRYPTVLVSASFVEIAVKKYLPKSPLKGD